MKVLSFIEEMFIGVEQDQGLVIIGPMGSITVIGLYQEVA